MRFFDENILNDTYSFIRSFELDNGYSPSLRDIQNGLKHYFKTSVSKVQRYVTELNNRDYLSYNKGIVTQDNLAASKTTLATILGSCSCGEPLLAVENIVATVRLPVEIFGDSQHFLLYAKGKSMVNRGIFDGDLMVVRVQNYAKIGEVVIARVNDEDVTAKIYSMENGIPFLKAANSEIDENGEKLYKDIYPKGEWSILGVVDNVIHSPVADEFK